MSLWCSLVVMAILGEKVFITLGPAAPPPPAQEVAPALIGCLLLKRQTGGELLGGMIVEIEAYGQSNRGELQHIRSI